MPAEEERCIELSQVLREELEALRPECFANVDCWEVGDEKQKRQEAYKIAHNLKLSALALSGGGIRSACVALGVIQSLAEARLLHQFKYLSTVSGGGYIGSWLSAWLYWNKTHGEKAEKVLTALTARRGNPDEEPEPIRHLRAYSSYLTPKLGLTSADTWAAVTLVVRNLVLNWLILVPMICLVVLSIKIAAGLLHTAVLVSSPLATILVALLLLTAAGWSLGCKLLRLYRTSAVDPNPNAKREEPNAKEEQGCFLLLSVLPAIVAGICFAWLANQRLTPATALAPSWLDLASGHQWCQAAAMAALAVIILGVVVTLLRRAGYIRLVFPSWDFVGWIFGTATTGAAIWLGVYLYITVRPLIATDPQLLASQAYANGVIGEDAYALILSQSGNLLVSLAGTTGHDAGGTSAASSTPTLPGMAVAVSTGTTPSSAKPSSTPGSSNAGAAESSRERRVVRVA
jgi:hypothetical protein